MTAVLETSRLLLLPIVTDMVTEEQVSWLNDPEIVKYSEQRHRRHTVETQRCYVMQVHAVGNHLWLIRKRANGGVALDIGTIGAVMDHNNQIADMGILIGRRDHWGQGYGREAWKCVMDFLFSHGVKKIEAGCDVENYSMRHICTMTMMKFEGVRPQHFLRDGKRFDLMHFGLCR